MKLRIHGDSLRLRLTRSEVAEFAASGSVKSKICFVGGGALHYSLIRSSVDSLAANFTGNEVVVEVPAALAASWPSSDEVTMSGSVHLADGTMLEVIVEKDFQCLHKGEAAKDPDAYPNPQA